MRAKYLFRLARICHVSPIDVDALRYLDFVRLCLDIDGYEKAIKDQQKQWNQQFGGR